jgi:predicted O-linked N-acetylglucosamine transferase (SPINDLY family)
MASISEAFSIALQHHQSGRLDLAEQIYRRILAADPQHADATQLLGLISYQVGQYQTALDLIRRAITLNPLADVYYNSLGLTYKALGRGQEAVEAFQQAVRLNPRVAGTHNNLGNALRDRGEFDQAVAAFQAALELDPSMAEAHNNLGNALRDQGKLDDAIASYRQALKINPDYADTHNNLGNVLGEQGKHAEAIACYERALQLRPDHVQALDNLGTALRDQGKLDEAIACYRRVLQLDPNYAISHGNLGNALRDRRRLEEAIACYRRALELTPGDATTHYNLGIALWEQGQFGDAETSLRRALELKPHFPAAYNNLGIVLENQGRFDEAIAAYHQALSMQPDLAEAHNNLGVVLYDEGRPAEAMACYQRALELKPDYALAHSNYLNALQYRPQITLQELLDAHLAYDRQHAAPLRATWTPHTNTAEPDRPLRLGFVSPSFGWHPAGRFLIQVLEHLDPAQAISYCYSDRNLQDSVAARFRVTAGEWRDVVGMSDEALATKIRADRIDILFDLAGHTGPNRLPVFARKPAPIQITWLDYEGTTGLSAIDYLLADRHVVPPEAERWYVEKVVRLPDGYACYDPPAEASEVSPLPALTSGHFTLGSFNLPAKITSEVATVWARILARIPTARLLLKYRGLDRPSTGERFRRLFTERGVAAERIELRGWSAFDDMLACYDEVDLALDPFPYNGGLTTCDALWMGVPVVTCPGQTFASRHGLTHLSNIGLTEMIAADLDAYVDLVVRLAADLPHLAEIRAGLRQRVAQSPLCDGRRLADNLLQLLRGLWREWCQTHAAS